MSKQRLVFYAQEPMGKGYAPDLNAPHWGAFIEDSKGQGYEDSNSGAGTATRENTSNTVGYKAYDRGLACGLQDVALHASNNLFWFQQQYIISPNGVVLHTVTSMQNIIDFGVHTGLYPVTTATGHVYLCGLYPAAAASTIGWVKLDTRTGIWTSGTVGGLVEPQGSRWGPCVAYQGRLVFAKTRLTFFDPVSETFEQRDYPFDGDRDRVVVSSGRLFVVSMGNSRIRVKEAAFGAVVEWLDLGPHSIGSEGDFGILKFGHDNQTVDDHNRFYVVFYTTSGGTGSRCYRIQTAADQGAPVSTNVDAMVPTAVTSNLIGGTESWQWPGGVAHASASWECAFDNTDLHPVSPGPHTMTKAVRNTPFFIDDSVTPRLDLVVGFSFQGEGTPMSVTGPTDMTGAAVANKRHSTTSSFLGGDDVRLNAGRPKWWLISAEAYSDGVTTRGMLLKFWGQHSTGTTGANIQVIYGRRQMRPNAFATLAAGSPALDYGGTAAFNGTLNRLEDCNPSDVPNSLTTLLHGAVTAGPFDVGATLTGSGSGATGDVQIQVSGATYVNTVAGGPFTPGETLTQSGGFGNDGATATLISQEDAVEHQVIWDLDADGVPDDEWVTVQPLASTGSDFLLANPLTTDEDVTYSGYTPAVFVGASSALPGDTPTPTTTQSGVVQEFTAAVGGTPVTTQSGAVQAFHSTGGTPATTQSDSVQAFPSTGGTPVTTQSDSVQAFPSTGGTPVTTQSDAVQVSPLAGVTPITTQSDAVQVSPSKFPATSSGVTSGFAQIPPTQTYGGSTGGVLPSTPPAQTYGGSTGGVLPSTPPAQTYSGTSKETVRIPPPRSYGAVSNGVFPPLPPSRHFGAMTGGIIIGLPAPIDLTATVVDAGCIRLDWVDPGPEELGFRLERSLGGADDWETIATLDADVETFLDRFAVPLTVYDYRVLGFDAIKESSPSNIDTAMTGLPPDNPTGPPPVAPVDPPRNRIRPKPFTFESPGVYGLEKDDEGDVTGFKY